MRFHLNHRVAITQTPILAKHLTPGVTGTIVDFRGYRAYDVLIDGTNSTYPCFPENLVRIAADAPIVPPPHKTLAPPRKQLVQRGKLATKGTY